MLHVTNGDVAADRLSQVFSHEVLAWRDVLHEGPVRDGLSLEQLSEERAAFIAQAGWGALAEVRESFRDRDRRLKGAGDHEEIVLWFEHDLYDQLQLTQLLDWFHAHPHPRLSLVCEAEYVSRMAPERMRGLFASRKSTPENFLNEARDAWAAFRSLDPCGIPTATQLPFLGAALRRHLQEFPWTTDGLSLLERRVLDVLEKEPLDFPRIFAAMEEDPAFLGDLVLRWHLARMQEEGLVARRGERWAYVGSKRARRVPRWLGGVLVDERCPWRWDPGSQKMGTVPVRM